MVEVSFLCVTVLGCLFLVQGNKSDRTDNNNRKEKKLLFELFQESIDKYVEKELVGQVDASFEKHNEKEFKRLKRNDEHIKRHLRRIDLRLGMTEEENRLLKMEVKKSQETNVRLERDLKNALNKISDVESLARNVTGRCECHHPIRSSEASTHTPSTEASPRSQRQARLIVASHGPETKMVEIRLDNHQNKSISINSRHVSAIVHDPSTNSFIWSRRSEDASTQGIYSSILGGTGEPSRLYSKSSMAMAVDITKGWLIFTTVNTISRISLLGGHYTLIHNMDRFSEQRGITLDPGNNLIYTCDGDYIIETDYTGKHQRIVLLGGFIVALTLDVDNNVLYFYEFDMIKKMSMRSRKTEVVKSGLGTRPKDFVFYDNSIYFVGMFEAYVKMFDIRRSATVSLGQFEWSGVSLCLVS